MLVPLEVYPAGEAPIANADGRSLSGSVRQRGQVDPVFVDDLEDLAVLANLLDADGDVVAHPGRRQCGSVAQALRSYDFTGGRS